METKNKSRLKIPSTRHEQQKRLFKNVNVNDLAVYMQRKGGKRVKRRKGRVKSNGKGFAAKEKIGSAESFLREKDLSRGHTFPSCTTNVIATMLAVFTRSRPLFRWIYTKSIKIWNIWHSSGVEPRQQSVGALPSYSSFLDDSPTDVPRLFSLVYRLINVGPPAYRRHDYSLCV